VGAAGRGVRAGVDAVVRADGRGRLAGVEGGGGAPRAGPPGALRGPAGPERALELAVLRLAERARGGGRDRGAAGRGRAHPGRVLAGAAFGWRAAAPVSCLGRVRVRAHVLARSAEPGRALSPDRARPARHSRIHRSRSGPGEGASMSKDVRAAVGVAATIAGLCLGTAALRRDLTALLGVP